MRVIDDQNEQLGIMTPQQALKIAEERGLDLVEVASTATPPVCRIMDYGKYLYQMNKKLHEAKKHQKNITVKEVKFRPNTDEHDYEFKKNHIIRFLKAGRQSQSGGIFSEAAKSSTRASVARYWIGWLRNFRKSVPSKRGQNGRSEFDCDLCSETGTEGSSARRRRASRNMKLKTHKGAAKRFKLTATGKVKRRHAFARHILTKKDGRAKKKTRQGSDCQRCG